MSTSRETSLSIKENKSTTSIENGSTKEQPSADIPPLEEAKAEFKPGRGFMLAFVSICIITLAAALDATSLSIALPIITDKLHGTAIEAFWAGTSFLLTSAVFQPVIAGLSHVFGRKEVSCMLLYGDQKLIFNFSSSSSLRFSSPSDLYSQPSLQTSP